MVLPENSKFTIKKKEPNGVYYVVACSCGRVQRKTKAQLERITQCRTCSNKSRALSTADKIVNTIYNTYVQSARVRNIDFTLTKQEVRAFIFMPCSYCKCSPSSTRQSFDGFYNGIDRIDSSKGYTKENCQTSCWRCNDMKGDLSHTQFLEQCKLIVQYSVDRSS